MSVPALRFPEFEGEWEEQEFEDIFEPLPTRNHQILASEIRRKGKYPVVDQGKEALAGFSDRDDKILSEVPLILFGDHTTILKYIDFPFVIGADGTKPLKVKSANVAFQYFNLLLNNVEQEGYKRHFSILRQKVLSSPSLPEQKKIAASLGVVDAKIAALRDRVAGLERYKRGLMQALFSQTLRFTKPDGSTFPDWEEKRLGEVAEVVTGKTPSIANDSLWNGDIMFVTPSDIEEGSKYQTSTSRMVLGDASAKLVPQGAILYTCIASVGKMVIATEPCITNQQINAVVPKSNSEFVYYALLCLTPRIKLLSANTTVPIVNKTEFCLVKLPFPHPDEQAKIAEALQALDAKITAVSAQFEKMQDFKKGLLQQMFV